MPICQNIRIGIWWYYTLEWFVSFVENVKCTRHDFFERFCHSNSEYAIRFQKKYYLHTAQMTFWSVSFSIKSRLFAFHTQTNNSKNLYTNDTTRYALQSWDKMWNLDIKFVGIRLLVRELLRWCWNWAVFPAKMLWPIFIFMSKFDVRTIWYVYLLTFVR